MPRTPTGATRSRGKPPAATTAQNVPQTSADKWRHIIPEMEARYVEEDRKTQEWLLFRLDEIKKRYQGAELCHFIGAVWRRVSHPAFNVGGARNL